MPKKGTSSTCDDVVSKEVKVTLFTLTGVITQTFGFFRYRDITDTQLAIAVPVR